MEASPSEHMQPLNIVTVLMYEFVGKGLLMKKVREVKDRVLPKN
jgi:hypothetical protein